jgi:hypothetical protein
MKPFAAAALAILVSVWSIPASAQSSPTDYLRIGEAVDHALGPNAELAPPVADALPPPSPPPLWYWRQPFDQQPFFATQPPVGTPGCLPRPGGPRC